MTRADTMTPRWSAARDGGPHGAAGHAPWAGRLRHALGATRRALERERLRVEQRMAGLHALDDAAIERELAELRAAARLGRLDGAGPDGGRARALALLAVLAGRELGMKPYPAQLVAALALHDGLLVELGDGEGKTLAVALAAILHAWRGRCCHVATANEYLAQRDAGRLRRLYDRCGLTVAFVAQAMQPEQASAAYRADVVYAGGKQLLADHLRDQLLLGGVDDALRLRLRHLTSAGAQRQPVMRGRQAVIVDDADTVLFNEATSPVIISAPSDNPMMIEALGAARALIESLQPGRDYRYRERRRDIEFTRAGELALDGLQHLLPPLWRARARRDDLVRQALLVRDLLRPQRHYVVQQGKLAIVDDHIGRLLNRPAWTQGLHQAIEIKEGLEPTPPSRVLARMSIARFFCGYRQLGGIGVGVAAPALRREARRVFGRLALRLPAAHASQRQTRPVAVFADQAAKRDALVADLLDLHDRGDACLVALRRISDAEAIARELAGRQVKCQFISTRQAGEVEAALANAVRRGQISLFLNLDIAGVDLPAPAPSVGLHLLQFEAQDLARQDRRIRHLPGRDGRPGSARLYLALDDDLFHYHLPAWLRRAHALIARDVPALLPRASGLLLRLAQSRAQRQARRLRRMQPRREAQLNQQLAFAGDLDMDVGAQRFAKH
jgi:preprotein translocase subunit SecA